jgi:hypothetical protein
LQTIPMISISNNKPAMALPLIGVVIVSMIKDAFEDYKRKKNDTLENTTKTQKWNGEKDWDTVPW